TSRPVALTECGPLQVPPLPLPASVAPTDDHQRRAEVSRFGCVVGERSDRICSTIRGPERGRPSVHLLVATERRVVHQRRCTDSFSTLATMNATLAGRSASRRIKYGYQCVPNGTYTRMLQPSRRNLFWRSRRTPYNIWNSNRLAGMALLLVNLLAWAMIF